MDVLSDVMRAIRLTGAVFFDVRAAEPLVATTPHMSLVGHDVMPGAAHVIPFHVMLRGTCWVESLESDEPPAEFSAGDVVLYPHGHAHVFVSELGMRMPPNMDLYRRNDGQTLPVMAHICDGPASIRFACGYLACDAKPFNPLLDSLPAQVLAKRPAEGNHIEVDLIQAAVIESEMRRAGSETVLARLSELLFVQVLRRFIEQLPERSEGWLSGLRDPHVSRALEAMHARPAHDWTIETLAREAGMSRANFADRFAQRVGETPMRYLAKWRMQLAAGMLQHRDLPIEAISEQVGYRSEAAFNRAFKGIVGLPPGAWRRQQQERLLVSA